MTTVHRADSIDAQILLAMVARDAEDLYRVAGRVLDVRGAKRTNTSLVVRSLVDFHIEPLVSMRAARD